VAGVLASLAELELELGRERRTAARDARRARGQSIGRPKALDQSKVGLAQRMHASGESASTIAATLGVSRATVYRVLAEGAWAAHVIRQPTATSAGHRAASAPAAGLSS
jgi:DNA invertase Pin-like site-specific DNA recombinase